jgi:hypothetical protein
MRSADEITAERVPSATDDVRSLVAELDRILSAEYPPEQRHGPAPDAIFRPSIRFFAARVHGVAEGCGGVELFAEFAEVKRMYLRETTRRARRGPGNTRANRGGNARRRTGSASPRNGCAPNRGAPLLRAGGVSNLLGIWCLRHNGAASHRDERFSPKAARTSGHERPRSRLVDERIRSPAKQV